MLVEKANQREFCPCKYGKCWAANLRRQSDMPNLIKECFWQSFPNCLKNYYAEILVSGYVN